MDLLREEQKSDLDLLTAGLSRNVALVTLLSLTIHAAGRSTIPNSLVKQQTVDVVWLSLMCGMAGIVQVVGVQLQVNAYIRAHTNHRKPTDGWWLLIVYAVMVAVVALFSVLYPILFVVLDQ